jgi:homoserine kinase type II
LAVLTAIDEQDGRELLASCGLGTLRVVEGLAAGSVNSNFALHTEDGRRFFLRLYEERDLAGARSETAMLARLAKAGVPTPAPMPRLDGSFVSVVRGKPATVFPWRDGHMRCQAGVTPEDARKVGAALARVHVAGANEPAEEGRFGFPDLLRRLDFIDASRDERFVPVAANLRDALVRAHQARDRRLPRGLTHGDLFRDNVLWEKTGDLAALLDFESACEGTYAYDFMVTVLSWCFAEDFEPKLASAMCAGYEAVRRLEESEKKALAAEGMFGALRFTITRITDYAMRVSDGPRVIKDWRRFLRRYERLQELGEAGVREMLGLR